MGDEPALTVGRLDLPAGGLVVVTGASGAGKSTLRLAAGRVLQVTRRLPAA
jgi:ABC-type lipoprotein export system ATPase subunit